MYTVDISNVSTGHVTAGYVSFGTYYRYFDVPPGRFTFDCDFAVGQSLIWSNTCSTLYPATLITMPFNGGSMSLSSSGLGYVSLIAERNYPVSWEGGSAGFCLGIMLLFLYAILRWSKWLGHQAG